MVKKEALLDQVFRALADPTRRAMLEALARGERRIGELAEPFAMSLAGASKHVRVLEAAGLVVREVRGREHFCRLEARPLEEAGSWLRRYELFWTRRLGALEAALGEVESGGRRPREGGSSGEAKHVTSPEGSKPAKRGQPAKDPRRKRP